MPVKSSPPPPGGATPAYPSARVAWYSTVLLALFYWLSLLDRSIISLMVDPIKNDIGISDVQFGMLHGLAFAVTFSAFGLLAGALVNRFSRRFFIFVSVAVWSLATAACLLLATPIAMVAATSDNPWVFLVGICLFMFLLSPLPAVYVASLNLVTPNELRGTGVAFFSATVGLVALSMGPIFIAMFSDYIYGGNAIGQGIATMVAICLPLAAVSLLTGRRAMHEAVEAAENWG